MSELEKIRREWAMLGSELEMMRESYLLRIVRNKRKPISERYAAIVRYRQASYLPDDCSDEKIIAEINQFLVAIDR